MGKGKREDYNNLYINKVSKQLEISAKKLKPLKMCQINDQTNKRTKAVTRGGLKRIFLKHNYLHSNNRSKQQIAPQGGK